MLTHDRIVFANRHLFGHRPCVLLGHIEVTGAGRRVQPDLDGRRLRHGLRSCFGESRSMRDPVEFVGTRLLSARPIESTVNR